MPETASRWLFGIQAAVIGLPIACFFILPFALPAALMLTPLALFGLAQTLIQGGPGMAGDLWAGLGVMMMGLVGLCATGALVCLFGLGIAFVARGRAALRGQSRLRRYGLAFAAPAILLSSLPRLVENLGAGPLDLDRLLASLLYSGLPLLIPAAHLLWESRIARRHGG